MTRRPLIDRTLWPAVILLAGVLAIFEIFPIDLWLQDRFYNPSHGGWWIDSKNPALRLIFYSGPKTLLFLLGGALLILCFGPRKIRDRLLATPAVRRDWIIVFATLATAPLLVSIGKATTDVFCPYELQRYGGKEAYQPLCRPYAPGERPLQPGRGFPAGHASGGFALLSLAGAGSSRGRRWAGVALGLAAGTLMGSYQMLKGAHFLSHTLVSALLCWIVFLSWRRVLTPATDHRRGIAAHPRATGPGARSRSRFPAS